LFSEFAQFKRDQSLRSDADRFAYNNVLKEKEDAERQRDELKLRMGAIWPQPMLAATQFGITHAHAHSAPPPTTHAHVDAAGAGAFGHASSAVSPTAGQIDASAGARAVQQQLANVRLRAAGGD
jgi:hypothetical protein